MRKILDRRIAAIQRIVGGPRHFRRVEACGERVIHQQAPGQAFANAENLLQHFHRLERSHDAGQCPKYPRLFAGREQIARRDFFWNGVVLYREKRWAEAYSQFQKARGPNDFDDGPLQLYVRRLEPLALHLVDGIDE